MTGYGAQSMTSPLWDVLLVAPGPLDPDTCRRCGWSPFNEDRLQDQFSAFAGLLISQGVRVHLGASSPPENPDAIYAHDGLLITNQGLITLRPGKSNRTDEPAQRAAELNALGVPALGALSGDALAEGGDLLWLRPDLLAVGLGWRTNMEGAAQLAALLAPLGVRVETFDLPYVSGPEACLHLMSLISLISPSLAVIHKPLAPTRLIQRLNALSISCVDVDPTEFPTLATNVLALAPAKVVALAHNTSTNARLRAAGVEVLTFEGPDLCVAGEGGPTCLTRPFWRA